MGSCLASPTTCGTPKPSRSRMRRFKWNRARSKIWAMPRSNSTGQEATRECLGRLQTEQRGPLGPAPRGPFAPQGRIRWRLGRDRARPEGRSGAERRPAPGRTRPKPSCSRRLRAHRRAPGRGGDALPNRRRHGAAAQGVVALPHVVQPRPPGRAADVDVAQSLRHQQSQGR